MYALIENNTVTKYPFNGTDLRLSRQDVSWPSGVLNDELLAAYNVLPVADVAQPAHNPATQTVDEFPPVFVAANNRWERSWAVRAKTAQELAAAQQQLQAEIVERTQQRLDDFARTRNYDGILSCASYATSTVPAFASEGQRAVALRDQTWTTLLGILNDVTDGLRPVPANFEEIEPELPVLSWT